MSEREHKITDVRLIRSPQKPEEGVNLVILERIEPGVEPDYCVHGKVTCIRCADWCWLGDATHEAVKSEAVAPLCKPCAEQVVPKDYQPLGWLHDSERHD